MKFKKLLIALISLIGFLFFLSPTINGHVDMEHYQRVCKKPLTVTATVTKHDTYEDSDDDTHYDTYISYVAEGVEYKNILYSSESSEKKQIPMNTQLEVDVSPEDPSALLSNLRATATIVYLFAPITLSLIISIYVSLLPCLRSGSLTDTKDTEIIVKDMKLTIMSRFFRPFSFILTVYFFFLCVRYPDINLIKTAIAGAVCCIVWLWRLYRTICDFRYIKNEEYEIRRDVLESKRISSDSNDGAVYCLTYRSGEKTWEHKTSRKHYYDAETGDKITAVYLPGKKKPLLHYDKNGVLY